MTTYESYCKIRDMKGYKDSHVATATGIGKSTFSDWKSGRSKPKNDKLQKIADFFEVTIDYLMTGEEKEDNETYYLNDDAREMAQFMFENPEYKVLFDASRKISKSDIATVKAIMDKFKSEE